MSAAPKLQLALRVPSQPVPLAGIPAVLRTAYALGSLRDVDRVVLAGAPESPPSSWERVLRLVPRLSEGLSKELPTLVLRGDGMPDPGELLRFYAEASRSPGRSAWIWRGEPVAAYFPAADLPDEHWPRARIASSLPATEAAWIPARDLADSRAAEASLFRALGKPNDGFLSRFDRRISTVISRRLARTAVTPNQVTWASIAVGLVAAFAIASSDWAICLAGTLLAWFSAILDGCDGEIARVKLLASSAGARLDLFGDHVVNFAVLTAIAVHVYHGRPWGFAVAALLLAVGVGASSLTVAHLTANGRQLAGLDLAVERLASRDFLYLVIPLAALSRLDWFFWAAAVGSNVFWLTLWVLHRRNRSARPSDTPSQSPA